MKPLRAGFDLRLVQPFVVLVDADLAFAAAARQLGVGPSALSRQIARLQRDLGATLLGVDGRIHVLTPAGERFLTHARPLLQQLQSLERLQARTASPSLRIHLGAGTVPAVEAVITGYVGSHPEVEVDVAQNPGRAACDALFEGRADVAVELSDACPEGATFAPVARVAVGVLTSTSHPVAREQGATWRDLDGETLLRLASPAAGSWNAWVRALLDREGVRVVAWTGAGARQLRFAAPAVARGEAVIVAPEGVLDVGANGVAWTALSPSATAEFGVVWRPELASDVARGFVDFAVARAGST